MRVGVLASWLHGLQVFVTSYATAWGLQNHTLALAEAEQQRRKVLSSVLLTARSDGPRRVRASPPVQNGVASIHASSATLPTRAKRRAIRSVPRYVTAKSVAPICVVSQCDLPERDARSVNAPCLERIHRSSSLETSSRSCMYRARSQRKEPRLLVAVVQVEDWHGVRRSKLPTTPRARCERRREQDKSSFTMDYNPRGAQLVKRPQAPPCQL